MFNLGLINHQNYPFIIITAIKVILMKISCLTLWVGKDNMHLLNGTT